MIESRARLAFVASLAALTACTARPATPSSVAAPSPCVIGSAATSRPDTITVALAQSIDAAHAPRPSNDAERFVFAQVYETLIDAGCDGRPRPALAHSWTLDETRTRVTLPLRDDARFANGDRLRAEDVVAAWRTTGERLADSGRLAATLASTSTVVDDRTLIVSLPDTQWLVLADRTLGVARHLSGDRWPQGTGPFRVQDSNSGALTLTPSNGGSPIVVRSGRTDARDAIDAGADLVPAAEPAAATYAATRLNLTTVALPWTRTYVLAAPMPDAVAGVIPASPDSAAVLRASLARDAVRAEARAASAPEWWREASCSQNAHSPAPTPGRRSTRIVYRRDDAAARGLAERLVALRRGLTAAGLSAPDFSRALERGDEAAYVVALPASPLASCRAMDALITSAPWIDATNLADVLVPLIDVRDRAIVDRNHVSATVDWDGTLRIRP